MLPDKPPLVSVIIAAYNHAPYVVTAVTSVLEQDYENIEIIVIDDGSDDGTPDLVERINDPRINLIRLERNRQVHPRNLGLRLSRGKYITFQNSDDEWTPGKLRAQIDVMEKKRNVVACFTGIEIIDANGDNLAESWADNLFTTRNRRSTDWLRYFFDRGNCLCLPSAVVRRAEINAVGRFRPSLIQLSDMDLWVRLAAKGEFQILEAKYTRMRIIKDVNLSRPSPVISRRSQNELVEVLWRYTEHPVREQLSRVFRDVISRHARSVPTILAGLARHALKIGNPAHLVFADRLLARILDDDEDREQVVAVYGTEIVHEFIRRRGELEVVIEREE